MKHFQTRLLEIYNQTIVDLEQLDSEHREFLNEAEENNNVSQNELDERMTLARDNQRRLQIAKAEKQLIESYKFE